MIIAHDDYVFDLMEPSVKDVVHRVRSVPVDSCPSVTSSPGASADLKPLATLL